MKKILIFSAKIPGGSLEADGGSMTVAQLVQNLYGHYHIDYMYLKKKSDEKPNPTREIENFYEADGTFLSYHTYNQENADKFLVRIENKTRVSRCIADIIGQYDAVIIIHCLQAFEIHVIGGLHCFLRKAAVDSKIPFLVSKVNNSHIELQAPSSGTFFPIVYDHFTRKNTVFLRRYCQIRALSYLIRHDCRGVC